MNEPHRGFGWLAIASRPIIRAITLAVFVAIAVSVYGCATTARAGVAAKASVASPEQGDGAENAQIIAGLAKIEKTVKNVQKTVNTNVDTTTSWIQAATTPLLGICVLGFFTLRSFWRNQSQ